MGYKWSVLRHMPSLCSVDIFKRICTSPVTPILAYIGCERVSRILAVSIKTCLNPPRGRGGKRIGTLASEDESPDMQLSWAFVASGFIEKIKKLKCIEKIQIGIP